MENEIDPNDESHLEASFARWQTLTPAEQAFEAAWAERHPCTYRESLQRARNKGL